MDDLEAQRAFWAELGGTPVQNGRLQMIEFPGAYVTLRQGQPTGGTVVSMINHIGFNVKRMEDWLPRWRAAGLEIAPMRRPTQAYLMAPGGIRVEILEDTAIANPLKFHHVHYFVVDPLEVQAWYAQMLGAVPGKRGNFDAGDLPGVNLTFSRSDDPLIPTMGRSLDHVGFEVNNLESFARKLEAAGVEFERPYQRMANSPLATASFVDPSHRGDVSVPAFVAALERSPRTPSSISNECFGPWPILPNRKSRSSVKSSSSNLPSSSRA